VSTDPINARVEVAPPVWEGGLDRRGRRRVTAVLSTTEIVSWGVLFYAFPVLGGTIANATGWSLVWLTAAFTAGQITAALLGIGVGRLLDRHGPRWLMTTGSVLAVAALVLIASAQSLAWFIAAWVLAGVAMSATLYPPAFAALTHWHDHHDRLRALTVLTVAGGLASTVFGPLTAWLAGLTDWRSAYLVLAALLAVVTIPLHAWGLRGPWPTPAPIADSDGPRPQPRTPGAPRLVVTAVTFALAGLAAYAVVVNLVPLLRERGTTLATAGVLLGLGGLGQVAGRLGYTSLVRRTNVLGRTLITFGAMALTTALLGLIDGLVMLTLLVLLAGTARGMSTLLQATAVTDRWGTLHYGRLTGILIAPASIAVAMAPWFGAYLAHRLGSYSDAFLVLAAIGLVAVALVPATVVRTHAGP
jgi:MFS family permease